MSHRLYHTEAILLGSRSYGEANRLLYLLTSDLGLVMVAAQGVRQPTSKLKGHLLDYTHLRVSLVRGRGIWRLTGAETVYRQLGQLGSEHRRWWLKLCQLARRLIRGEMADPELFVRFNAWYTNLALIKDPGVLRYQALLCHLELLQLLGHAPVPEAANHRVLSDENRLIGQINQALEYSQL